jgi:predicted small metal-binding protein
MNWELTCACGWVTEGDREAVVEAAQEHGRDLHNMEVTEADAMAMARPAQA